MFEQVSNFARRRERLLGTANPKRVRPYHHGNRLPVTGDRHLLAAKDAIEQLGQRGSGFAHRYRHRHGPIVHGRTTTYYAVGSTTSTPSR